MIESFNCRVLAAEPILTSADSRPGDLEKLRSQLATILTMRSIDGSTVKGWAEQIGFQRSKFKTGNHFARAWVHKRPKR